MKIQDLQNRKIAIVGLGVNNQKMADYFSSHGIEFDVIQNWKSPDELIGKLDQYDIIFRTPGLPYLTEAIQQAKSKGVEISSQTKLFFALCPSLIIGVTGTKGKGTTSSLIYEILKAAGKDVYLGGNIGRDPFEFLDGLTSQSLVVLELSSFQLQDLEVSPDMAVVLSITSDHLNHHQDLAEYIDAKTNIISHQKVRSAAVLHKSLPESFTKLGQGKKIFFEPADFSEWPRQLLGRHNLDNIAAAAATAELLGVNEKTIQAEVASFQPLPHRLKLVREVDGVNYIDDGYSTNIDPLLAAVQAVEGSLILICGGFDKGIDFTALGEKLQELPNVKAIIVVGAMTDKIIKILSDYPGKILTGAKDMPEIIAQARSVANDGDTIVFSPGTASFDMFQNETDRAEQFVQEVNQL